VLIQHTHQKKYLDSGIRTRKRDLIINVSPLLCRLVYQGTWATNRNIGLTSVLLSEGSDKSSTLIPDFLQIRQTCWCLCLTDVQHKSLQLMEGIDKPHTGKYKEITNDSNYDASCTVASLPVWVLENFKRLIFVVQTVHNINKFILNTFLHKTKHKTVNNGTCSALSFQTLHVYLV
jgi:hypothetical protein